MEHFSTSGRPDIENVTSSAAMHRRSADGRRRVLVADDHPDTRLMLRTILEMNRFDVLEAANGKEVIEMTERERPDIVLMDFSLPVVDGLTAFRRLKEKQTTSRVPVIFLSGRAEPAPQIAAREAGCRDYLIKPIDLDQMLRLIKLRIVSNDGLTK